MEEQIKSAAIMADGHIFVGDRHDLIFRIMSKFGVERLIAIRGKQGFITTLNRFVDRVEALEIATRENQILKKYRPLNQLLSEDMKLWEK